MPKSSDQRNRSRAGARWVMKQKHAKALRPRGTLSWNIHTIFASVINCLGLLCCLTIELGESQIDFKGNMLPLEL